jgi:hypothetical protein
VNGGANSSPDADDKEYAASQALHPAFLSPQGFERRSIYGIVSMPPEFIAVVRFHGIEKDAPRPRPGGKNSPGSDVWNVHHGIFRTSSLPPRIQFLFPHLPLQLLRKDKRIILFAEDIDRNEDFLPVERFRTSPGRSPGTSSFPRLPDPTVLSRQERQLDFFGGQVPDGPDVVG